MDCENRTVGDRKGSFIIKVYRRRYWMLFIFSTLSMLNGTIFQQYTITADVTVCYYGVSEEAVNWTSLTFMVVYIILSFPVSWLIQRFGLRPIVIAGSLCTVISYLTQFEILSPERFSYVMVTSFFGALGNVCVLAVPPCLAATWFPSTEVSRACAMGVFGNQLGVALGSLISPLMISDDCSNKDLISNGKWNVAVMFTTLNIIVLFLIITTFQNKPEFPPSPSQAAKKDTCEESYLRSALSMARNLHFMLIFIVYGIVGGTAITISNLLNSLMLYYFPKAHVDVGWLGMLFIVSGLVGSVIAGYVLDRTHKFKETAISICFSSFIFSVVFSCLLKVNKMWLQYIIVCVFGFFMTSFAPVGFEYAIEITYPESEVASAGLCNCGTVIFGVIITEITSYVLIHMGPDYALAIMSLALLSSAVITCFITKQYNRCEKNNEV